MPETRDEKTEAVRSLLAPFATETPYADSGLTTLSFQSTVDPLRHVWIDTDLAGRMIVDLEDWRGTDKWDDSVAHLTINDIAGLAEIAKFWLSGRPLEYCKGLGGEELDLI
jgi:hypothetical protein